MRCEVQIDLDKIRDRLFSDKTLRKKIFVDLEGDAQATSTDELTIEQCGIRVIEALRQAVSNSPLAENFTNIDVFCAAVWALGSNSRSGQHF